VQIALPYQFADDEQEASTAVAGLLVHLDTIYGFALTLTGDADAAAELTEEVFGRARDDRWGTLGGHGLRDRLLARCVAVFCETFSAHGSVSAPGRTPVEQPPATTLGAVLRELPWDERAAIALVDQLHLSYAAGAAVLGVDVPEFRTLLHHGRAVLLVAYRVATR